MLHRCPQATALALLRVEATSPEGYDDYNAVIECGQTNMCFDEQGAETKHVSMRTALPSAPFFGEPLFPGDGDCIAWTACLEACDPMALTTETCTSLKEVLARQVLTT